MRYMAVLGFNTKQWWVYDNKKDLYIDPPIEVLDELEKLDDTDEQERLLEKLANQEPDWLFDKGYRYKAKKFDI